MYCNNEEKSMQFKSKQTEKARHTHFTFSMWNVIKIEIIIKSFYYYYHLKKEEKKPHMKVTVNVDRNTFIFEKFVILMTKSCHFVWVWPISNGQPVVWKNEMWVKLWQYCHRTDWELRAISTRKKIHHVTPSWCSCSSGVKCVCVAVAVEISYFCFLQKKR